MYVNITTLLKLDNPLTLPLLLALKQASKKDMSEQINLLIPSITDLDILQAGDFITYIKGSKGSSPLSNMRLGKKGRDFLQDLDEPDVEPQDERVFDWLANIYKEKEKQIGNGKKTKRLIAAFREKSGIEKNCLAYLCNQFILDDEEQEWSFKLEYVFWKPTNLFQTKFVLEDSRLWKYYHKKKEFFDTKFKELDTK